MARRTGTLQLIWPGRQAECMARPRSASGFLQGIRSFRNAIQGDHQGKDEIADQKTEPSVCTFCELFLAVILTTRSIRLRRRLS
jgi:hypothetical protein